MASSERQSQSVSGTVSAFNFIRRIGFPPTADIVTIFLTLATLAVVLSLPFSGLSLVLTLDVAITAIIVPTILGEFLCSVIILRGETILNFRRLMGMETLSWSPMLLLLPIYSLAGALLGDRTLWVDGLFVGLALSIPIRFLTIFSMSRLSQTRKLVGSITVPLLSLLLYTTATSSAVSSKDITFESLLLDKVGSQLSVSITLLIVGLLSWICVSRIIGGVTRQGSDAIGDAPMELFQDFLRHWLEGEGGPLENRLAALGRTGRIDVSTLAFEGAGGRKSGVIISNFHPGPYRDLGSGGLPSMLKSSVEKANSTMVMVPHGVSNHEYNIISKGDILSLIKEASSKYPAADGSHESSILVRQASGDAKATVQIFGDTAFVTLTLAPIDMEDIPARVGEALEAAAKANGLNVIVADAHNSLKNQISITETQADMLRDAGKKALAKAIELPRMPFRIGAASDPLKEFKIEDGIGPGGISALTVDSQGQRVAYVTIDGNNMQQGFRQILLESIRAEGMDEGEVMTTDTHLVAGVVRSPLGYHPVGEGINRDILISRVREVVKTAASDMRSGSTGFNTISLDLRVLGSSSFQSITSFVGRIARRIGRSFMRLELVVLVLSVVIMLVL